MAGIVRSSSEKAPRDFTYITPRKRRVSEYEAVTCYTQPDPDAFDKEGWYLRTSEGRTAWLRESTRLTHPHWFDFRDPASQWQRTYVRMQAEQERSIERACEDAAQAGSFAGFDPVWTSEILGGHYRIWSFFEYGVFRAFAAAQRETLADTISNTYIFESVDRVRHAQDIVLYLMELEDQIDGFLDAGAKERWLTDPMYQPLRSVVEHLIALPDWAELAVATNLVIDPIVSEVCLSQLVRRFGPFHGDHVTPFIISTTERDRRRNLGWTEELVRMTTASTLDQGDTNREIIQGWIDKWTPIALDATRAMAGVYEVPPLAVGKFDDALAAAVATQNGIVEALGLSAKADRS